jgi:hypothetical protein
VIFECEYCGSLLGAAPRLCERCGASRARRIEEPIQQNAPDKHPYHVSRPQKAEWDLFTIAGTLGACLVILLLVAFLISLIGVILTG